MFISEPREAEDIPVEELRGMQLRSELNNAEDLFNRLLRNYSPKGKTLITITNYRNEIIETKKKLDMVMILQSTDEGVRNWLKTLYRDYSNLARKCRMGK